MMTSPTVRLEDLPNLQQLLESRWSELHDGQQQESVFRYQLIIERERVTDGRAGFLLQLNRQRTTERRKPDIFSGLRPLFDPTRFNFNKVDSREILLEFTIGSTLVSILINNSPLTRNHVLIVPDLTQNQPQVLTADSLTVAVQLMLKLADRNYRILYNSPGALASVNHLHLHLLHISHKLYVEDACLTELQNGLYRLDNQPAKAYCFVLDPLSSTATEFANRVHQLIRILISNNLAHNFFLTWNHNRSNLCAFVYPRLVACENKQIAPFNVAACELSGFVPLGLESDYERLDEQQLEAYFQQAQGEHLYATVDGLVARGR
ncbi:GDP-D-glucose phosphorylase 1 [Wyeomyia smithii]|uniref:GDP-D-glucose phosphorylase 1 n=1 Tax=Wyeomyia smithii TaxID=174621 RepID=UPI00246819CB|nr:GDP-D-glucose phosphorylase 1 [Wyeomyia smithii]XP_055524153.1 GDP-D-glucose phosphorylase 1 [Wyeomyia smithii]